MNIMRIITCSILLLLSLSGQVKGKEADDILAKYGSSVFPSWVADATLEHNPDKSQMRLYRANARYFAKLNKFAIARNLFSIVIANSSANYDDWQLMIRQGMFANTRPILNKALHEAAYAYSNIATSNRQRAEILFIAGDILHRLGQVNSTSIIWRKGLGLKSNKIYADKLSNLGKSSKKIKVKKIKIGRLTARSTTHQASLCLNFDDYWRRVENFGLEHKKYISISPAHEFNIRNGYGELCLDDLEPDTSYRVTVSKDMPIA